MKKITIIIALSLLSIGNAFAADSYWGIDIRSINYKSNGFETNLTAFSGKLGYELTDYINIESMIGTGISDGDTGSAVINLDYILGAHLKGEYPINTSFSIYGIVGYTSAQLTAKTTKDKATDTTSSATYGAGLGYNINNNTTIFLDYTKYIDRSYLELSGLTLGYKYSF